jgi:hypothetical protein
MRDGTRKNQFGRGILQKRSTWTQSRRAAHFTVQTKM